ncbi:MAG: hypothetical protein M3Y73_04870 [Actinomycetota bacterium]|nr:hypothetical protein [Actinomycetota bacterium]
MAHRFADAAVTTPQDQQVRVQIHRCGEAGAQLPGLMDREGSQQVETGGGQLGADALVEASSPSGSGVDHQGGAPTPTDRRVEVGLAAHPVQCRIHHRVSDRHH